MSTPTSQLELVIRTDAVDGVPAPWSWGVEILVDAEPLLGPHKKLWVGQPPNELIDDPNFAEPGSTPHEVILGRCNCGELGCGAVVGSVYRVDDLVIWDLITRGNPSPLDLAGPRPARDAISFALDQHQQQITRVQDEYTRLKQSHDDSGPA